MANDAVEMLRLELHGRGVGYLAGYRSGRNVMVFDDAWRLDASRPTLSLSLLPDFPRAAEVMQTPWVRQQRLHPWFSNLLPEGALRSWLAQRLKVHPDNEFPLLARLGDDLPGALRVSPVLPNDMPDWVLSHRRSITPRRRIAEVGGGFSLAGVQMKFSMRERDGRFHFGHADEFGDWIVKTPSTRHRRVPENEATTMWMAQSAGVEIPEIRLIPLNALEGLPAINLPDEHLAYAIRRFDREGGQRIHAEDMAQVLFRYPHEKYDGPNYEQIGRLLREFTTDGLDNVQAFARRLLVDILLANGDAHLKNWSLIYPDQRTPRLAPAYDIVNTLAYLEGDHRLALNLNGKKDWYRLGEDDFRRWAEKAGVAWPAIRTVLDDTIERARARWPRQLVELPMDDAHKAILKRHWRHLAPEWRIG
ncbi:type II toxin-antitoxin system HipA family toxin [Halomonas urumqiensis]|uniref:Phosphatidylinositol kinase n=1 Tax=Halomonas urumqiensis TaxID=1684789 RepID=A0A2N7UMM6_9GAMM|nr:HipA domain-containing protein [Halomonas urumqiensis]PMR81681.1 phosphatidylinositol kinase [Halomonas urumqiensis]PTB02318.1 type II toxin-antitoxin system HipA family toxin [Halomonas urumqiensis]GHE21790.1 phosphatidylinositol kinase [Halomonas urumqiensis]